MSRIFTILLVLASAAVFCQTGGVGINPTGSQPDPSAILDLSAPNKGLLVPRVSEGQRNAIGSPALGLLIYDTTTNCFEVYGFGNWQSVSCLCNGAPSTPGVVTGNTSPCADAPSVTYSVGLVLGATTYTWTAPSDATIIAGQGTNSITVNFGVSPGNVTVVANNSCGSSSASTAPVTINSVPGTPGTITGNPYPCANSTAQAYSVPAVNGATSYTWSVPSGSIVTAGQGSTSALVNFSTTPGNVAVTANNSCGSSSASVLPIAMAITPSTPGSIAGPVSVTNFESGVVYSITPVTEATTYTWSVPPGAVITAGQGTDSITMTFGYNGSVCVAAGNCAGTSSASCLNVLNSCYSSNSQTFSYTGATQTFTVPCGVDSINITVWGAAGGAGDSYGGAGAGGPGGYANGTLSVTGGQAILVNVGGAGIANTYTGGWNGGGAGGEGSGHYAGGGGGGTDLRLPADSSLNGRIIVAGGGGGGSDGPGGYGGGSIGYSYGNTELQGNDDGTAGGGTQSAGGAAGPGVPASWPNCASNGNAGSFGTGANGVYNYYPESCGVYNSGGGGGGWYGGGSGGTSGDFSGKPGAGGSGYLGGVNNGTMQTGVQSGNGLVIISW